MKKFVTLALAALLVTSLAIAVGCAKKGGGDTLVGTWGMVDNPTKTVKITTEAGQYFYEGSQGKSPATKKDENTLLVTMGPVEVTVKHDPASGILTVAFMGETYQYKKVQ